MCTVFVCVGGGGSSVCTNRCSCFPAKRDVHSCEHGPAECYGVSNLYRCVYVCVMSMCMCAAKMDSLNVMMFPIGCGTVV